MKSSRSRSGFTLIEVLIVVVIMAVLAATIIPQFSTSTNDAKVSSLKFNLQSMRTQIELYKMQHNGAVPAITAGALPQLTGITDVTGALGVTPGDPLYPYGPYIQTALPPNPFDSKATVTAVTGTFPPAAATGSGGWAYNATTGQMCANTANYLTY